MAKTESIELPATDALDETRIGSFAGWGAVKATFHGDLLAHLTYPALEQDRVYQVDPVTGLITARIA